MQKMIQKHCKNDYTTQAARVKRNSRST